MESSGLQEDIVSFNTFISTLESLGCSFLDQHRVCTFAAETWGHATGVRAFGVLQWMGCKWPAYDSGLIST